jgi:hypothetical protein
MFTKGSFPVIKAAGRETDNTTPTSTEVKNAWSYTSTTQYAFMTWCSAKTQRIYLFTFYHLPEGAKKFHESPQ